MKYLSLIEPLEIRIAPATLINPSTVIFHDVDGDDVTVKFSKPVIDSLGTANALLTFNTGNIDEDGANDTPQQLQKIDIGSLPPEVFTGLSFSVTAKRSKTLGGDGFVDVGYVNAVGIDIGKVVIGGDLGRIEAGFTDATTTLAIQSLTVQSMGELGTSTQAAGGTLESTVQGPVGAIVIKGHLRDASIIVDGGTIAKIGSVTIGGSVLGGSIVADGDINSVKIAGSLIGGTAAQTGKIQTLESLGTVTVGGSVVGTAEGTGVIRAVGDIASVKIGVDLRGGPGEDSGLVIASSDSIFSVTVGGSVVGVGPSSGGIIAHDELVKVVIGGDVRGGDGNDSGLISCDDGELRSLTIKGSLFGGAGANSGSIYAEDGLDSVVIGKSVRAGSGTGSASITCDDLAGSVTIGGSLEGYLGPNTGTNGEEGAMISAEFIQSVKIAGSIYGGNGDDSAKIYGSFDGLGAIKVGGSIVGGGGENSGSITGEAIQSITVGGDLRGGGGDFSASLTTPGGEGIGKVFIGGSVYTGAGELSASIGGYTGLPSVTIKGNLVGTPAVPAVISSNYNPFTATKEFATLGKINIGGRVEYAQILAGYSGDTPITADSWIDSVVVGGDWIASSIVAGVKPGMGGFGTADDTLITPLNDPPPAISKIGSVVIKGQARGTPAGIAAMDSYGIVAESIGSIKIGGVTEKLDPEAVDAVPLGATGDFFAREDVAGGNVTLPTLTGSTDVTQVSPKIFTFTDVDGDLVTVKTTKAVLELADFITTASGAGVQLQEIRLANHVAAANNGVGMTITAKPQDLNEDGIPDGDGFVNVGYLNAAGLDLGAVSIAGDLGKLTVGDAVLTSLGLKSLTVQSMGVFGNTTQAGGGNLDTEIFGPAGPITIRGEALNARIGVSGTGGGTAPDAGDLKSLTVGGSWTGGVTIVSGKIGAVKIGRDLVGDQGNFTGRIQALGEMGAVKIGGNILGGGQGSGRVESDVRIASVTVGGNVLGGSGPSSGGIDGGDALGAVTIKGSVIGGGGNNSANIQALFGEGFIKAVKIGGDVRGGSGMQSAFIHAGVNMGAVVIGGSFVGGSGPTSAAIYAGSAIVEPHKMKGVTIGGDVVGGSDDYSAIIGSASGALGSIVNLDIGSITIKGGLYGGTGPLSASITANNVSKIAIGLGVIGLGTQSAYLNATGQVGKLTIGGSVEGQGTSSGYLSVQTLGSLAIKGDLRGGSGNLSGFIFVNLAGAKSIKIGGAVVSGSEDNAGDIEVNGPLGSLAIGEVLGTAEHPVVIRARGVDGEIKPPALGKLTIKGSATYLNVLAGYGALSGVELNADATIGSISVGGTWTAGSIVAGTNPGTDGKYGTLDDEIGNLGNDDAFISKIGSIKIKGRALGTVGGADDFGFVAEHLAALQIGAVKFPLAKNGKNDNLQSDDPLFIISSTGDFRAKEIGVLIG